jgi:hypothetical protein
LLLEGCVLTLVVAFWVGGLAALSDYWVAHQPQPPAGTGVTYIYACGERVEEGAQQLTPAQRELLRDVGPTCGPTWQRLGSLHRPRASGCHEGRIASRRLGNHNC